AALQSPLFLGRILCVRTMKDSDILVLRSFFYALAQQQAALPDTVNAQMNQIAQSLDTRVSELNALARSTPTLAAPYKSALRWLVNHAAERGMGLDALPDKYDETDNVEQENLARNLDTHFNDMKQAFEIIDQKLDNPAQVLTAPDPVQAIRQAPAT
ncbi:MAG: hypothetical protein WBA10_16210, partial [Elainellaceae cyanobacterium]